MKNNKGFTFLRSKKANPLLKFSNNGFTLIEMLVVILIIGILLGLSLSSLNGARKSSRDAKRKADLATLQSAIEQYKADNGFYPTSDGWCTVVWGCGSPSSPTFRQFRDAIVPKYLSTLLQDSTNKDTNNDYLYVRLSSSKYELYSYLEMSQSTPQNPQGAAVCACEGTYYYKVTNP